jgi:NAD(P)-dependent dehydrogenase (short-subunit alcohol dehydrogenase family)
VSILVVGCSDGIGLSLTNLLVERGHRVVGISRRSSPLRDANYTHHVLDVTSPDYSSALEGILASLEGLDHVVYGAGIGNRWDEGGIHEDAHVFQVNLLGALSTAACALPHLDTSAGTFLVLSSQADAIVSHEAPSYCASKAALSSYFEGLGLGYRRAGRRARISNLRLGFVDTKMARSGWQPFRITARHAAEVVCSHLFGACPLRITYPRKMAPLVALIAWIQRCRVAWAYRRPRARQARPLCPGAPFPPPPTSPHDSDGN